MAVGPAWKRLPPPLTAGALTAGVDADNNVGAESRNDLTGPNQLLLRTSQAENYVSVATSVGAPPGGVRMGEASEDSLSCNSQATKAGDRDRHVPWLSLWLPRQGRGQ